MLPIILSGAPTPTPPALWAGGVEKSKGPQL